MKTTLLILPATALALTATLVASAPVAQDTIKVGDVAKHSFREAPTNSMGVKSLTELRGKPVLVEFWGTH